MPQRLIQSATATVAADGTVRLVFSTTPLSSVWTGSISIPKSPTSVVWNAALLGKPIGSWQGATVFGPIQCWGGEQIIVTGSNLTPGLALEASWTGMSEDESYESPTPLPFPNSIPSFNPSQIPLIAGTIVGTPGVSTQQNFTIPSGSPPFTDIMLGTVGTGGSQTNMLSVIGLDSGILYLQPTLFQNGRYITCPFSTIFDPDGFQVGLFTVNPVGPTMFIQVVGLLYPTTSRPYVYNTAVANPQGPDHYASGGAVNGTTILINGGSAPGPGPGQVLRIWAAWASAYQNASASGGGFNIAVSCVGQTIIACQCPQSTTTLGTGGANGVSYPGGLPFQTGANNTIISSPTPIIAVQAGVAYSIDHP